MFRLLKQLMDRRDLDTCSPRTNNHWNFQGVDIDVLHPSDKDTKRCFDSGDTNNASVVLRVSFAGKRVLLTADVQGKGWQWIVERKTDLQADVLKFPHHGAWYDTTGGYPSLEDVLGLVNPSVVVVSVGTRNPYNHPHINTFALLQKQSRLRIVCTEATGQCHSLLAGLRGFQQCAGTVEVVLNESGLRVLPDTMTHNGVIRNFDQPQCQKR